MTHETPRDQWNRLQEQIQNGILEGYPNPDRNGCPHGNVLVDLALRAARFDDSIEDDPQWQHVTHCSPCYGRYLEEFQLVQMRRPVAASE
jgi:hypothetical protein